MTKDDVNVPVEGTVTPPVGIDQPLPGQPEPTPVAPVEPGAPSEPQPGDPTNVDEKSVPLAALHEERNKRQALQAELELMRQVAGDSVLFDVNGRPVPQRQVQPQQQQQTAQPQGPDMEKLWEEDPRKAVQQEIVSAMQWKDNIDVAVDQQELLASSKYADYDRYRMTVRQYIRALPMSQRGAEGVVDLAYYIVKGQQTNPNDIYAQAQADLLAKIKAGESVQGLPGTPPAAPAAKANAPTQEQMNVAAAMGLSLEDYMAGQVAQKRA